MTPTLALHGGAPVRANVLPYARQFVDAEDVAAVTRTLESDLLTTGPRIVEFERAVAELVGAREAVVVSSGTAALHAAMNATIRDSRCDVIVPALTFAATANAVVYQGGTPVFADVDEDTLLVTATHAEARLTERTRAIAPVDFAGQPCEYAGLRDLANQRELSLVADACHALGATCEGRPAGSLADLTVFSFHPVKHITTGEGGMITTDDSQMASRMRRFRNHGINLDAAARQKLGSWEYDIDALGYNYRLSDFQCALGLSQLAKLPRWLERRRELALQYDKALSGIDAIAPLSVRGNVQHAYHLYVVRLDLDVLTADRGEIFAALRAEGIGVNVHYRPVHLHSFYRTNFQTRPGMCPIAEGAYQRILTLPLYPAMTDLDVEDVVTALDKVLAFYGR